MTHEELETRLRTGEMPPRYSFVDVEKMKSFVDHRKETVELTDLECEIAKSSAKRKADGRRKHYGDFAVSNFLTGNKGEMAVAKYLHSIHLFKDLSRAVDLSRRDWGDRGVDIRWGRWRIDVKTTGTHYGELVADTNKPDYSGANLFILAHLRSDGMQKIEGTNTWKMKDNIVDIYGFLTTGEFYETDENNKLIRAEYYDHPQLPTKYKVQCWRLRPIRDLRPTTTA